MRDLTNFIAHPNETLSDVFKKMEKNEHGIIFVCEDSGMFIGVATDGDIRRSLLATRDMDMPIVNCVNRDCVTASSQDSREYVLKLLDHRVHVVPILDSDSRIVDFASNRFFPLAPERAVVVRSAAPVRISFGGGGTDLTHFFVSNEMGAVLSATIRRYSYCTLIKRSDRKIVIRSSDIDAKIETDNLGELQKDDRFSLIGAVLELIQPCFGFELDIRSEFEVGSGLGGSSVVLAAIIGCFNQLREDPWDNHEIAGNGFSSRKNTFGQNRGWQDQYATVFGGLNFMEFRESGNTILPMKLRKEILFELESNLILCSTGRSHDSGQLHAKQKEKYASDESIQEIVRATRDLVFEMKTLLLRGQVDKFGECLDKGWNLKKKFSNEVSNGEMDQIYELAKSNGATGGKLLGAGGGGYFLFYVPTENRVMLEKALLNKGLKTYPVHFDEEGLRTWRVRKG